MLRLIEKTVAKEAEEEVASLDELAREGARRMLVIALETEVAQYLERYAGERDGHGHALVVRNGKSGARKVTLGAATIDVQTPRVNDRRRDEHGERRRFASEILPPYMRRSPKVAEVLPILYLRGLSTGDFRPALQGLLGEDAAGLSATNIARLTAQWDVEYQVFRKQSLADKDYVYVWVDGVHFNVRLEDDRLCTLVMIGARPDGSKELVAVEDGYRESAVFISPPSSLIAAGAGVSRMLAQRGSLSPVFDDYSRVEAGPAAHGSIPQDQDMGHVKKTVLDLVKKLPDDCTLEDVQYELYVRQKVARSMQAASAGRVSDHEQVKKRLSKWLAR